MRIDQQQYRGQDKPPTGPNEGAKRANEHPDRQQPQVRCHASSCHAASDTKLPMSQGQRSRAQSRSLYILSVSASPLLPLTVWMEKHGQNRVRYATVWRQSILLLV